MSGVETTPEEAVAQLRSLEEGPRAFFAVCALGADAVPALTALLAGPTEPVDQPRRLAADALGAIGGVAAADALLAALEESAARHRALPPVLREAESGVLGSLAEALSRLADHRAPEALVRILEESCHAGCLAALASFRDARAVGFAARCLRDGAASGPATWVLRSYGRASLQALAETLASSLFDHGVEPPTSAAGRALAATLLGELAGRAAERALTAALGDAAPAVRLAAALALAPLGADLAARAAPELARALGHAELPGAGEAEDALARLVPSPQKILAPLLAAPAEDAATRRCRLKAVEVLGRLEGGRGVAALASLARHGDPEVRFAAATALARTPGEGAEGALRELLGDPDRDVRRRARAGLALVLARHRRSAGRA